MVIQRLRASSVSALLAAVVLQACSGGGNDGSTSSGGPPATFCSSNLAGTQVCFGYSNLTTQQQAAVSSACTSSLQGTIASSCPPGQVGCCTVTAGYTTTECYYAGTASALASACAAANGDWSGADGAHDGGSSNTSSSGNSTSSGSSGGSSSGGSSGGACSSPEVTCPKGCANLETDVNNCASCGYVCPAGPSGTAASCVAGACKYACSTPGETLCTTLSEATVCLNLETDANNCGQCGKTCTSGPAGSVATCESGTCEYACPTGEAACTSAGCIGILSDSSNCGGCDKFCGANTICESGQCVAGCVAGETLCSGVCKYLPTDPDNCGACGNVCPYTASGCESSMCSCEVPCEDQYGDPYCCMGGETCFENGCE
jgi:hypothetical protein